MFQLKKCNNCAYCTVINPPRLPVAEFQSLHFLPDPVSGGDGHYQTFDEVYGQVTGDTYRPSAQVQDDPATANHRRNRDTFKTQKVRDVINLLYVESAQNQDVSTVIKSLPVNKRNCCCV